MHKSRDVTFQTTENLFISSFLVLRTNNCCLFYGDTIYPNRFSSRLVSRFNNKKTTREIQEERKRHLRFFRNLLANDITENYTNISWFLYKHVSLTKVVRNLNCEDVVK